MASSHSPQWLFAISHPGDQHGLERDCHGTRGRQLRALQPAARLPSYPMRRGWRSGGQRQPRWLPPRTSRRVQRQPSTQKRHRLGRLRQPGSIPPHPHDIGCQLGRAFDPYFMPQTRCVDVALDRRLAADRGSQRVSAWPATLRCCGWNRTWHGRDHDLLVPCVGGDLRPRQAS
jgi:hypothetical protein